MNRDLRGSRTPLEAEIARAFCWRTRSEHLEEGSVGDFNSWRLAYQAQV